MNLFSTNQLFYKVTTLALAGCCFTVEMKLKRQKNNNNNKILETATTRYACIEKLLCVGVMR